MKSEQRVSAVKIHRRLPSESRKGQDRSRKGGRRVRRGGSCSGLLNDAGEGVLFQEPELQRENILVLVGDGLNINPFQRQRSSLRTGIVCP